MKRFFLFLIALTTIMFSACTEYSPHHSIVHYTPLTYNQPQHTIPLLHHYHHTNYPIPNIKAKLLHMPAEQLKIYFEVHQWSQDDIIKCAPLYQSDEFIKFLKTVTEYSVIIRTLHETCSNASRMQKFLWILQNKYYKGFIKRLAYLKQQQELQEKEHARIARQKTLEQKQQASSQHGIIQTLNTADSYFTCAQSINNLTAQVFTEAKNKNAIISNELENFVDYALDELYEPQSDQHFVFNAALVNHVLSDMYDSSENDSTQSSSLLKKALTTFVTNLNPVTQVTQWVDFIVDTAHFVADVTVGKLYLTPTQYQTRINNAYNTLSALSWNNLSQISKEQWIDLGAKIAADCVFMMGVTKIAAYLKELQVISKMQKRASQVAEVLHESMVTRLTKNHITINADGTMMKYGGEIPDAFSRVPKHFITDAKKILINLQGSLNAEVKHCIPQLRKKYDCIRKGFADFADKYIKINYKHIFGMDLKFSKKGLLDIGGFHLDPFERIEKNGSIEFSKKITNKDGLYKAQLIFEGHPAKHTATFFPSHWSREQVIEAILEAYDDFIQSGQIATINNKNIYELVGKTKNNINIEIKMTQSGKIITAYPKF